MVVIKLRTVCSISILASSVFLLSKSEKTTTDHTTYDSKNPSVARLAIIGGGIGGTSCAYFVRELLGDRVLIDLYEPGEIGGRISTIHLAGRDYESGGSIIHPRNKYMVHYADKFGLKHREECKSLMGAYDGEEFVFEESSYGLVTLLRMWWQYGWRDIYGLQREVGKLLKTFDNIYDLQDGGQSFATLRELMQAMGGDNFVNWTMVPTEQVLRELKFSDKFISEVVSLATRVNYGQNPTMEGFAGFVSLAGTQPGLWAVEGGNRNLALRFLENSRATRIQRSVATVSLLSGGAGRADKPSFVVTSTGEDEPDGERRTEYDMVIVAAPLVAGVSAIRFEDFPGPVGPYLGEYRSTVATFVNGTVNGTTFGRGPGRYLPDAILTTRDIPLRIRSVAKNFPVDFKKGADESSHVYKIFSTDRVTEEQMGKVFSSVSESKSRPWLAYPYYRDVDIDTVAPFRLHEGLFYVNAIEWASSAMEMSAIGARNAALLAKQYWAGPEEGTHYTRNEL